MENPMGLDGFEFIEFASTDKEKMLKQFSNMGFAPFWQHQSMDITVLRQGDINFIINNAEGSMAERFRHTHGPSISAMGFRVKNAEYAFKRALKLGAREYRGERGKTSVQAPAIYGIGESLIYFIDRYQSTNEIYQDNFNRISSESFIQGVGLTYLDHVTHNVLRGNMDEWAVFYQQIFNFRQIRYFDIRGIQTGLISRALTSPCNKIRIPLNESTDNESQIEEYLQLYNGEGIQHIALGSANIYDSVETMRLRGLRFLKVPDTYYEQIPERIPGHGEDLSRMQRNKILIDGNAQTEEGLLLQIFTGNMVGPAFFEIIERKGNQGFGEGNFRALFVAMELDQIRRGVLKAKTDKVDI
ncbi:MAG: 4-hydroxyphenylpyruvate dioxygenase [Legionellales bacterium]|nr:4-hydroxyphenylpyruvate dioxygenase [Legionellales bacterium]